MAHRKRISKTNLRRYIILIKIADGSTKYYYCGIDLGFMPTRKCAIQYPTIYEARTMSSFLIGQSNMLRDYKYDSISLIPLSKEEENPIFFSENIKSNIKYLNRKKKIREDAWEEHLQLFEKELAEGDIELRTETKECVNCLCFTCQRSDSIRRRISGRPCRQCILCTQNKNKKPYGNFKIECDRYVRESY